MSFSFQLRREVPARSSAKICINFPAEKGGVVMSRPAKEESRFRVALLPRQRTTFAHTLSILARATTDFASREEKWRTSTDHSNYIKTDPLRSGKLDVVLSTTGTTLLSSSTNSLNTGLIGGVTFRCSLVREGVNCTGCFVTRNSCARTFSIHDMKIKCMKILS